VDGFSNSSDIADLFADKFQELYTTVDFDKDELLDICNDLNVFFPDVDSKPLLSVTPTDVLCAIRRLKSGKFDNDSGLSTDHFVNACDELAVHLSML